MKLRAGSSRSPKKTPLKVVVDKEQRILLEGCCRRTYAAHPTTRILDAADAACCSTRGWTAISQIELAAQRHRDLVARHLGQIQRKEHMKSDGSPVQASGLWAWRKGR
jgi:hypothetical protein